MGAMLTKCFGSIANDPKKLEMVINKCFGMFDKDNSGQIDAAEARTCAERVLKMAGVTSVPPGQVDSIFNKVAGTDQKLDKAEFTLLVNQVLSKAGVATAPVAAAPVATPAADAAAPAAAAAPVAPQ